MSSETLTSAFKLDLKPSALKFTLIALCECENHETGKVFPSVAHICAMTGQNRKTVMANMARLIELGILTETDERKGSTGQVKVYQITVPKTGPLEAKRVPKTAPLNCPKNGTVSEGKSPVFTIKESQKRDTELSREPISISNEIDSDPPLSENEVLEAWNHLADRHGLAKVKRLTDQRRKNLKARLRDHSIDDFTEAIAAIERNPWLQGQNDRGWRADFDFFVQPKSFVKLIEGAYDH